MTRLKLSPIFRNMFDFHGYKLCDVIDFSIEYWIEKDTYWLTKIENKIELEMNIQGLVTPIKLNNSVKLYDYNKEMEIEAPI